ncbi:MAG: biotin--[acetyl-CoA-carboxylase] ligase [Ktedonobacteraceae bacterium]|nr:biotin--[acetyl-CoA-carboxylase] ligase [Ktedonobacteraceae bacterium]
MNEMKAPSGLLNVEQIQHQLETTQLGVGKRLVFLPTVNSTNTFAMNLARTGSEEGVVVLTDSQTAGKGRQGRHWIDKPGLHAISSTILRPSFPPYLLVMVASLAVIDAIAETCGVAATIKWPNDILIGTRKIAGILIETSYDSDNQLVAVLGIGVNVNGLITQLVGNNPEIPDIAQKELDTLIQTATTLEAECGHPVSRETFLAHLLRHIETSYLALQQEARTPEVYASASSSRLLRERWRTHLSTLGRTIEIRQGQTVLSGVAEDVNENGELLLRSHSTKRVSITWGDVWYVPDTHTR